MDTLAPGSTLGQYQIIDKIAAGGFGTVYRALHLNMQREVALKVLLPSLSEDSVFVERFKREAQATAALRHPHIVEIYDANSVGERYFLAMEYLPGGNLQKRLAQLREQRKLMPVEEALQVARQIASALDYAHAKGFVHRDIKPSNILIDEDDRYVLTDFGIVSAQDARTRLTMNSAALGTPEYMAPEQAQGEPPDARSDIYALGVVLYEMLAGAPPFTADTPWAVIYKHIKEPPPPIKRIRPDLPAAVKAVLDRSLAKDPAARYQTAAQMVVAIDAAMGKTATPKRKRPPLALVLGSVFGLIAALAFAFAGVTFFSNNAARPNLISAAVAPAADKATATQVVVVAKPATPKPTSKPTRPTPTPALTAEPFISFEDLVGDQIGNPPYGRLTRDYEVVRDGLFSAKLSYNFPAVANNFVVFTTSLKLSPNASGFSAFVYGDGSGHYLNVWLQDNSGQVRQQTFGRVLHKGWRLMFAQFMPYQPTWPENVLIKGPDKGILTPPYTLKALVLDGIPDGKASKGVIYIDAVQMTCTYGTC